MLRTIFWTMIFFLGATMVAIQPACNKFGDRPMRRISMQKTGDIYHTHTVVWNW